MPNQMRIQGTVRSGFSIRDPKELAIDDLSLGELVDLLRGEHSKLDLGAEKKKKREEKKREKKN